MFSRFKKVYVFILPAAIFLLSGSPGSNAEAAEQGKDASGQSEQSTLKPSQERLLRFDLAASELSKYYAPKYDPDKDDADWYAATAWLTQRCYQEMYDATLQMDADEVRDVIARSELLPPNFWGRILGNYGAEFAKGEYLRYLKLKLHGAQKEFATVCVFAHTSPESYKPPVHMAAFFDGFRNVASVKAKETPAR